MGALRALAMGVILLSGSRAFGQTKEADHVAVLEIGGAADWGLTEGPSTVGGTVAVEVTPIERWLEVEAGIAAFGTNGRREVSTDLVFKKPFPLLPAVELMAGAGPELAWNLSGRRHMRSLSAELALNVMFWSTRRLGWYVEPSYNFSGFRARSDRSLGVTAGLLVGLP